MDDLPEATLRYEVVDVFSDVPLAGNGLAVVNVTDRSPEKTTGEWMQRVARAFNLSETTFVRQSTDDSYRVRIFTPATELSFAGHPTLGTAFTLGTGRWRQTSGANGEVTTRVEVAGDSTARFFQPDPALTEVYPDDAAAACGLPLREATKAFVGEVGGTRHLLLVTTQPLATVRFDGGRALVAARAVRATGLGVLRAIDECVIELRLVVPSATGIFEDPGTGSAAAAVAVLAQRQFGTGIDVTVVQGIEIGRPSRMEVHAEPGAMTVGGAVARFASGAILV